MDLNKLKSNSSPRLNLANYFTTGPKRDYWGPRVLKDYEFVYIVEGEGYYFDDQKAHLEFGKNELILIPPAVRHTVACDKVPGTVISCIHFDCAREFAGRVPRKFTATSDAEILALFRKAAEEYDHKRPGHAHLLNALLMEILVRLARLELKPEGPEPPMKVRQAQRYMERRYRDAVTRTDIARHLEVTPEYLNFLFQKHCRMTPLDYLLDLRLRTAKALLRNPGWNVSDVAREVGFEDPLYFSRVFRKRVGVPPREYAGTL
ncbi:MAG: AraC family transcriptional regulator [Fibrobacterota bacterium]